MWSDQLATPDLLGPFAGPAPGLPEDRSGASYVFADTDAQLQSAIQDADVVFGWNYFTNPKMLQRALPFAHHLRWVQAAGVGIERLLFPELINSDVILTNGAGVYEQTIAEYAVMLMLLFAKDVVQTVHDQQAHRWEFRGPKNDTLQGRELVVVGVGGIGRAIARQGRTFGMKTIGVARSGRDGDADFDIIHPISDLLRVLPTADYVVLIVPSTPDTNGMMGEEAFRLMKPSARLINLGRGELVVEAALLAALRNGEIAGAALDVFWKEPLPKDHPLWDMPNVIVSPHIAGDVATTPEQFVELFLNNLSRWQSGQELVNVVDKQLGFAPLSATAG
ncbi:MAG: D-2-hydroxyacid dehydrogenase [Candidatus Dormibacteria bacterium]